MGDQDPFAAVAQKVVPGGRLQRSWPLEGGVSASMQALEISDPGGSLQCVVVRQPGGKDCKALDAGAAATELALLETLGGLGLPVPKPCLLDESGAVLPAPYFVMEHIDGTTSVSDAALPGAMRQMAHFLGRLHALDLAELDLPTLPVLEDPREGALHYLPRGASTARLREVLESRTTPLPKNAPSLLHGDFWPGNVLWNDGGIAAVVDWEDASTGDPVSDLAASRAEILCEHGEAAMDSFTEHYLACRDVDLSELALWEVYVSAAAIAMMSEWGLDPEVEAARRRRTSAFLERAMNDLLSSE